MVCLSFSESNDSDDKTVGEDNEAQRRTRGWWTGELAGHGFSGSERSQRRGEVSWPGVFRDWLNRRVATDAICDRSPVTSLATELQQLQASEFRSVLLPPCTSPTPLTRNSIQLNDSFNTTQYFQAISAKCFTLSLPLYLPLFFSFFRPDTVDVTATYELPTVVSYITHQLKFVIHLFIYLYLFMILCKKYKNIS